MRPVRNLVALLSLAVVALLAACAPSAAGSVANPFVAADGGVFVKRGETIVVRVDFAVDQFGIEGRDLPAAMWVPAGANAEIGDVTGGFRMTDVRVAAGWDLRLLQMRAERRSVASGVRYRLWALFEVRTDPASVPGPYRVRATLEADGGGSAPVAFAVDTRP